MLAMNFVVTMRHACTEAEAYFCSFTVQKTPAEIQYGAENLHSKAVCGWLQL